MTLSTGSTAPDFEQDSTVGHIRFHDDIGDSWVSCPMSTGRNLDEVLRLLDSSHKVTTPANWQSGEDDIIVPAVKGDEAKERFPGSWKAPKPCLRIVPQPSD